MADIDYSRASVLLFDPVHVNQRTTRYALFEIGFRQIECVSSLKEFRAALVESSPALIVSESSATDQDVFKLVRSVRRSELGGNPFVLWLLTTWSRDTSHIRRAIECGADDVIVRPFSTSFAEERVRALVNNRKGFVVTSDYVGPDRRKNADRESDAPILKVPNFLKASIENDHQALAEGSKWIKEASSAIISERMRRLAMRIVVSVELQLGKSEEGGASIALDIDDLERTARELKAQLLRQKREEAAEVAEALIEHTLTLKEQTQMSGSTLRLVKELAMGAYAAYANGDSIERSKDEIGRTVENLRRKIQSRADADAKRNAESSAAGTAIDAAKRAAASNASQSEAAGIKRAAM